MFQTGSFPMICVWPGKFAKQANTTHVRAARFNWRHLLTASANTEQLMIERGVMLKFIMMANGDTM